jgi:hypothetical protein
VGRDGLTGHGNSPAIHRRPASLVGGSVIAIGMGLMQCGSVLPGALALLFHHAELPREMAAQRPEMFGYPMTWLLSHMGQWLALQGTLGLFAVTLGVGVWLGWPQARRASQIVMLALVASWLTAGIILGVSLRDPSDGGPVVGGALVFFRMAAVGVGAAWAGVSALPVWLLERHDARAWFEERGRPTIG